jgi:hypothetical protein
MMVKKSDYIISFFSSHNSKKIFPPVKSDFMTVTLTPCKYIYRIFKCKNNLVDTIFTISRKTNCHDREEDSSAG